VVTTAASQAERWNLDELFADPAAVAEAESSLEERIPALARFAGQLGASPARLAAALDEITEVHQTLALLRTFAGLRADLDTRVSSAQGARERVDLLAVEFASVTAYLRPEILALPEGTIERFLVSAPALAPHAFLLRDIERRRPHVLGPGEERILSSSSMLGSTPPALFELLNNAELPRPEVALSSGQTVRLTPVQFQALRATTVRADRALVFPAYFGAYAAFRETLGCNLFGTVKNHVFRARARGYPSCVAAALDPDAVPISVYRTLIAEVRRHLPVLHRYFGLRARALGLSRLHYSDLHCPIGAHAPRVYDPASAREVVEHSLEPLGSTYGRALARAFDSRWVDWHPAPGKRAGAYSNGCAYAVHPYVLLNFTRDFESVSTLAHELGHAMHSHWSNRAQPYATADYSIFVAEVASTLNEALLQEHVHAQADDDDERRFLLGTFLDGLRATLFRQTMFAEFELLIHERVESGEALTGEELSASYLRLLREYHGHDRGVVQVDDAYAIEWACVPHFHYDFYVYQYATGIVAAMALAEQILTEGEPAAERYLEFLSAGGSDYPLALLRRAGVDLERREPYALAIAAIDRRLDALEGLLGSS
jgi:oligoendopeptidase F